jgi:hypothetical protein
MDGTVVLGARAKTSQSNIAGRSVNSIRRDHRDG